MAVVLPLGAEAAGDAVFRWFKYCPGVERLVKAPRRGKRAKVQQPVCTTDSFSSAQLADCWLYLNGPDSENYRLMPEGLRLTPTYVNLANMYYSPTAIFTEPADSSFIASCEVDFMPLTHHDFAGMALYADAGTTIVCGRAMVNGHQAVVVRYRHDGQAETAFQPLQEYELARPVWLRLKCHGGECSFFYSTNRGVTWIPVANNLAFPQQEIMLGLYTTTNLR